MSKIGVKPQFTTELFYDTDTGLRRIELKLLYGFPEKYVGTYKFVEWTYGENIAIEMECMKSDGKLDVGKYVILQCISCMKEAPFKTPLTVDEIKALPGRIGTIYSNISDYVCTTSDAEKKG